MPTEVRLDARELEPPEPFERATSLLRQLEPGHYLRMLHRRVPYPLFDFCQAMSLAFSVVENSAAACEIIIYHPADEQALRQGLIL